MTDNRSSSARNLLGSFLGGLLGILACAYVAPAALPIGAFLGVIIGWWAGDIAHLCVTAFQYGITTWQKFLLALHRVGRLEQEPGVSLGWLRRRQLITKVYTYYCWQG